MKLASLEPLTPGFVEGLTESATTELEESHGRRPNEGAGGPPDQNSRNEGMGMYRDDEDDLENAEDDMDHADDLEMDAEEDLGDIDAAEVGDDSMISVSVFLKALETALEKASGEEVEIDADLDDDGMDVDGMDDAEAMEVDTDMEMGDEDVDVDMMQEGTDEDVTTEGSEDDLEEGTEKGGKRKTARRAYMEESDDLVEQVTKRVAARILKSALTKK